jgi:DNA-binding transcriptional MerR regulator
MDLTVSVVADRVGLSPDAVRYYERVGLLPPPARSAGGYRLYDEAAVERLRFVKGAQRVGLRLREIGELLEVVDRGQCPCGHTDALLRERLAEVDAELARLGALRATLARLLAERPEAGCAAETAAEWWCVQAFAKEGGDGDGSVPELRLPVR